MREPEEVVQQVIHNTDMPSLSVKISRQVMDYETESFFLSASAETSKDAKKSMLWLIQNIESLRCQRGV